MVVAVTKLETIDPSKVQLRYKEIVQEMGSYLKKVGYPPSSATFVPVSALDGRLCCYKPVLISLAGDNIIPQAWQATPLNSRGSSYPIRNWYSGPTLWEAM